MRNSEFSLLVGAMMAVMGGFIALSGATQPQNLITIGVGGIFIIVGYMFLRDNFK